MKTARRIAWGLLIPGLLAAFWTLEAALHLIPAHLLPAPWEVLAWIGQSLGDATLLAHLASTFLRILAGFALGVALALPLGFATGLSRRLCWAIDPLLQALRSIPSLAWVPLFLIWLGIGEESKVALIALGVFFPVYLNLNAGLAGLDRKLVELGRVLGYRGWLLIRRIHLPAVAPALWTGLRSGLGLGWMFVVAAEILGASRGLGYLLEYGRNIARPEIILASIFLFALVGKITDGVLAFFEKRSLVWRDTLEGAR